jgi:hypothetical protein
MLITVHRNVFLEVTQIDEELAAHITRICVLFAVYLLMSAQMSLVFK